MSINETLERLEDEGKLVRYHRPSLLPMKRSLFMTSDFCREIQNSGAALDFFGQSRWITALFDSWVLGQEFIVRRSGRGTGAMLARLEPPPSEICEFRVVEPKPQVRLFAQFLDTDTIIVFFARNRDRLGPAKNKAGKPSRSWQEALYGCESEWIRIFGRPNTFRGNRLTDYVSENAYECA